MSGNMNVLKNIWIIATMLTVNTACHTITEKLQPCSNYVSFTYTRNMKFVDAFPVEVKKIDLFVFDAEDRFITCISRQAPFEESGKMELPLPSGKYHLIVWAGLYESSYLFKKELVKGVSTPDELTVKMQREYVDGESGVANMNKELDALWHAEAYVELTDSQSRHITMDLTKNTNKMRLVVQMHDGSPLISDDLEFSITGRNGFLNFDNSLLPDSTVIYRPYYFQNVTFQEDTDEDGISAAVTEMNTLRLVEHEKMRLQISRKDGEKLVDIDLIQYLLLTKMEGHQLPVQEYLDRQDEYAMIFWLAIDGKGNYMIMQIKINDWILRPQDADL